MTAPEQTPVLDEAVRLLSICLAGQTADEFSAACVIRPFYDAFVVRPFMKPNAAGEGRSSRHSLFTVYVCVCL